MCMINRTMVMFFSLSHFSPTKCDNCKIFAPLDLWKIKHKSSAKHWGGKEWRLKTRYSSSASHSPPMRCFLLSKTALKDSLSARSLSVNLLFDSLMLLLPVGCEAPSSSCTGLEFCKKKIPFVRMLSKQKNLVMQGKFKTNAWWTTYITIPKWLLNLKTISPEYTGSRLDLSGCLRFIEWVSRFYDTYVMNTMDIIYK